MRTVIPVIQFKTVEKLVRCLKVKEIHIEEAIREDAIDVGILDIYVVSVGNLEGLMVVI